MDVRGDYDFNFCIDSGKANFFDVEKNKQKIILSDYKLLNNTLLKEIKISEFFTKGNWLFF